MFIRKLQLFAALSAVLVFTTASQADPPKFQFRFGDRNSLGRSSGNASEIPSRSRRRDAGRSGGFNVNLGNVFQPQSSFEPQTSNPSLRPQEGRSPSRVPSGNRRPSAPSNNQLQPFKPGKLTFPGITTTPNRRPGSGSRFPELNPNVVRPGKTPEIKLPTFPNNRLPNNRPDIRFPGNRIPDLVTPGRKPDVTLPGTSGRLPRPGITRPNLTRPLKPIRPLAIGKNGLVDLNGRENQRPSLKLKDRLQGGQLNSLMNTGIGKKLDLRRQLNLFGKGDVARQLGLQNKILKSGGWRKHAKCGPLADAFFKTHFGCWSPGHACLPAWCWCPHWSDWVSWCWWDHCHVHFDPRPIWCQPIVCDPCVAWVHCHYPVWQPLPHGCGTWVDVPPVVLDAGLDLQMLAVRMVDPGHPEQDLGPRYRVWFRNNSDVAIDIPFNVLLMAGNDRLPAIDLPQQGVRVTSMEAGQIQSTDIRLPVAANTMTVDADGHKVPFKYLHVVVDSHREVPEHFEENNGAILARGDVLMVDPAAFSTDTDTITPGQLISIAGEGFGPEPGRVILFVNGLELQSEIHGWYDLGARVRVPDLPIASLTEVDLLVVRGDGATANPLPVRLAPAGSLISATVPAP